MSLPSCDASESSYCQPIYLQICAEIPTDLPVLGTAVAGECALLIGVDRDLLDMQKIHEIPIIRPGEYWRQTNVID